MDVALGIIALVLTIPAWLGQVVAAIKPSTAERFGLIEPETDVDPAFYADVRAECAWDSITLWVLPLAGLLLLLGNRSWTLFGLAGGGMYVYFAGRGILQRITMRRRGIGVGKSGAVASAIVALSVWGLTGGGIMALAIIDMFSQ